MDKIEIIKSLYEKVQDKNDFHQAVADEFGLKKSSIRTNWFGNRFEVPEKYGVRDKVIEFAENYIENQPEEVVEDGQ